jgi:hypothetical protein
MNSIEVEDHIHVYSMFLFSDGRREAGILINKFNISSFQVEYYFVPQYQMQVYKNAFETYDPETCHRVSEKVDLKDLVSISAVSLADYKVIMQLLVERNQLMNLNRR